MVSFDFKPAFVDHILSGRKIQTIRREKRCNVGDTAYDEDGFVPSDNVYECSYDMAQAYEDQE